MDAEGWEYTVGKHKAGNTGQIHRKCLAVAVNTAIFSNGSCTASISVYPNSGKYFEETGLSFSQSCMFLCPGGSYKEDWIQGSLTLITLCHILNSCLYFSMFLANVLNPV